MREEEKPPQFFTIERTYTLLSEARLPRYHLSIRRQIPYTHICAHFHKELFPVIGMVPLKLRLFTAFTFLRDLKPVYHLYHWISPEHRCPVAPKGLSMLRPSSASNVRLRMLAWSLPILIFRILCMIRESFVCRAQSLISRKTNHNVSPIFAATTHIVMNAFIPCDLGPD